MHVCIPVSMCVYLCVCMYMFVCICMFVCVDHSEGHMQVHPFLDCMYVFRHIFMHTCIYVCVNVCLCAKRSPPDVPFGAYIYVCVMCVCV